MTLTSDIWNLLILCLFYLTLGQMAESQQQQQQQQQQQAPVVPQAQKLRPILIPNLPTKHYQFWLKNHPIAFKEFQESICSRVEELTSSSMDLITFKAAHLNLIIEDPMYFQELNYGKSVLKEICSRIGNVTKSCWGYENHCQIIYLMPECYGSHLGQAKSEQDQKVTWFNQGDFGYILNRRKEMAKFCSPDRHSNHSIVSSLECSRSFKICRGENLMIKLTTTGELVPLQVGGWNCDLQKKRIEEELRLRAADSNDWFDALKNYDLILGKSDEDLCEITIDKPVILMKLNSLDNLHKYMSNFVNLYATIHLNNRFSDDIQIIVWDNSKSPLKRSNFDAMWQVFSRNAIKTMGQFSGKRVCFKKFITNISPEKQDELFYERPLMSGCSRTGLFDAFSKHVLHRLRIPQVADPRGFGPDFVRLIILTRSPGKRLHRRILNEYNLINRLKQELGTKKYSIEFYDPDKTSFMQMLLIAQNTDVLIGMHSTSLTYSLFLPDWASLVEVHNCGNDNYRDLARLKGVSYFTINDKERFIKKLPTDDSEEFKRLQAAKLDDHEMFSNYEIDEAEFVSLVRKASDQVKRARAKYLPEFEAKVDAKQPQEVTSPQPRPSPPQPQPAEKTTYTDEEKPEVPVTTNPPPISTEQPKHEEL